MSGHVRSQIRDAVVARLSGLPTSGARVYSGRTRTLAKDHSPTLLVYATREDSDSDAMGGTLRRELTLVVEARAVATGDGAAANLEDTLDTMAAEVETAMVADPGMGGLALEVTLTASRINAESPGENHAGEARLEYRVVYRTKESAPTVAV